MGCSASYDAFKALAQTGQQAGKLASRFARTSLETYPLKNNSEHHLYLMCNAY
jgi:hypothetical protein